MIANLKNGLLALLPLTLTLAVAYFLLSFLTDPFLELVEPLNLPTPLPQLLVLGALVTFISFIGLAAEYLLVKAFLTYSDKLLHRLPLVNTIYKISKDAIHSAFAALRQNPSQVVTPYFPSLDQQTLSFTLASSFKVQGQEFTPVLLSGAPTPALAFVLLYKTDKLPHSSQSSEEAMKTLVSLGSSTLNKVNGHGGEPFSG